MRRNKVVVVVVDIVGHCLFELVFALASFRFARYTVLTRRGGVSQGHKVIYFYVVSALQLCLCVINIDVRAGGGGGGGGEWGFGCEMFRAKRS